MADAMKRVRPMADAMKRRRPDAMKRGRPCLILVRRRHELLDILLREVVVFKTDTTRMRRMIVIAFFQQLAVLSSAFMCMDFNFCFCLYRKRNIDLLSTHFARKRNLFVKVQEVQGIEITRCTLAGLMGRADPANAIT